MSEDLPIVKTDRKHICFVTRLKQVQCYCISPSVKLSQTLHIENCA